MDAGPVHRLYEFGDFRVDALRRVLTSRTDREPLPVTGKIFDALLYFLERPGQLLDKRELMDELWPNVVVEEGNLTQTIHTLRRLLGERPDEHRYIVTVPGRGYRFVADVRCTGESSADIPARARSLKRVMLVCASLIFIVALASLALRSLDDPPSATPATTSIAVLPFVDMSPEKNQEYFADGLSEEILNALAQSASLRVIARTSSFSFKNRSVDIATIAEELGVTHVLEGSVRKSGERIRVTAQLVDAAQSAHLWSQTYDRDLEEVFAVQTDIAEAVTKALQITLSGALDTGRGESTSAHAFERYLQGRYFFQRRGVGDVERARRYFEDAVRIDPGYARAWAGLGGVYYVADEGKVMPDAIAARWREAIENALELGPNIAEIHVRAAQYHRENGDESAADAHLQRAAALNPSDPLLLGVASSREVLSGHIPEAVALLRRALSVDPLSAGTRVNLAVHLLAVGAREEARAEFERALEISSRLELNADIVRILVLDRRYEEALLRTEHVPAGRERDQCLALVYHGLGKPTDSDAALMRLLTSEKKDPGPAIHLSIAEVYAFRGLTDEAFRWLQLASYRARREHSVAPGWWTSEELHLSPFLAPLHSDPRWQALLVSMQKS